MKMSKLHWLAFLSCCGLLSCSLGLGVNAYGVFLTPVSQALQVTRASVALHVTLSGLSVGLFCPIIVKLLQKGHARLILAVCVVLNAAAYFFMAFAHQIWMFNLLGIVRGFGSAGFYTATVTIILGNWFEKNLGTVTGIAVSFSGIAGAILSPLLTYIITEHSYQAAYIFCAAFVLALSLPFPLLLSLHPEEKGLLPYGAGTRATTVTATESRHNLVNKLNYRSVLFLLLMTIAFTTAAEVGITSHLSGYAQSIGSTAAMGAAMMSACMVGNITSKTLFGFMSDHMSAMLVFAIMLCANTAGLLIILFAQGTVWLLLLGSVLFGGIYSVTTVGLAALVRGLYGNQQYGNAYSMAISMGSIANAVFITFIGFLFDFTGSFSSALILGIVIGLINLILLASVCKLGQRHRTWEDR